MVGISTMVVFCAEVGPKAMADTGVKGRLAEHCLGLLHSKLMIVLDLSTALLCACIFPKPEEYCHVPQV